jgi:hypothetical protein
VLITSTYSSFYLVFKPTKRYSKKLPLISVFRHELLPELEQRGGNNFRSPDTWPDRNSSQPRVPLGTAIKDDSDVIRQRDAGEELAAADSTELKELRFYAEQVEADNKMLRELVENQKNDIDCLLKLSNKARNSGVWCVEFKYGSKLFSDSGSGSGSRFRFLMT